MASTSSSLSYSFITALNASRSLVTPVEVSLWVISTALIFGSSFKTLRIASGSAALPHSKLRGITSAPNCSAILAKRSPKTPIDTDKTLSPGDSILTTVASSPPVPEAESTKTSPLVWNNCFRLSVILFNIPPNSGPRWFIICLVIACKTSSGTGVGPGMRRFSISSPLLGIFIYYSGKTAFAKSNYFTTRAIGYLAS